MIMHKFDFGTKHPEIVRHLLTISAPTENVANAVISKLLLEIENDVCHCSVCQGQKAMAAETLVILEEMLKMLPSKEKAEELGMEDCESGVASLMYRLHESRMRELGPFCVAVMNQASEIYSKIRDNGNPKMFEVPLKDAEPLLERLLEHVRSMKKEKEGKDK
jgi:hypothetical protein